MHYIKQTLRHYFKMLAENQHIYWDADKDAEIGSIIDEIDGRFKKLENKISML